MTSSDGSLETRNTSPTPRSGSPTRPDAPRTGRATWPGRWQKGTIGTLLAQAEDSHTSASTCLAFREDATLWRAPATILDHQRGGMLCLQHVPDEVAEEITSPSRGAPSKGGLITVARWIAGARRRPRPSTPHCPTHGPRRYSRGEVRQVERDETRRCWFTRRRAEKASCLQRMKAREIDYMALVTRTPMALKLTVATQLTVSVGLVQDVMIPQRLFVNRQKRSAGWRSGAYGGRTWRCRPTETRL
jgi:hypothetical protein